MSIPQFAEAIYNLGVVMYRTGYRNVARALWLHATTLDPDLVVAWYNLGAPAYRAGRFGDAERCWGHCVEHSEPWPLPYELFHVIVDLERDKKSLAPSDLAAHPVTLNLLSRERLLSAVVKRLKQNTLETTSGWDSLFPDVLPAGLWASQTQVPSGTELLSVLQEAILGEPLSNPQEEFLALVPAVKKAGGFEALNEFLPRGGRLVGGSPNDAGRATAEFRVTDGAC